MADTGIAVTIYHNPNCGTSRNTLALIRNAGVEPTVIEYLKSPPDRATLESLLERMHMTPRVLLRRTAQRTPQTHAAARRGDLNRNRCDSAASGSDIFSRYRGDDLSTVKEGLAPPRLMPAAESVRCRT